MAKQTRTTTSERSPTAAKKSAAQASAKKPIAATGTSTKSKTAAAAQTKPTATAEASTQPHVDREGMIQNAAYHIAERDGFQHGKEQEYWLQAEQQIDQLLKGRREIH